MWHQSGITKIEFRQRRNVMKRTLLSMIVATSLTTAAYAGDMDTDNKWEKGAKDAWIDGKAEATLLFNGNLDSFDINTDVKNGNVILTGKVENSVDKKLAEELIANIDGVKSVDNKLTIVANNESDSSVSDDMESTYDKGTSELTDAKIATVIKTRLLMDTDISGFDIDVDVEDGNVTLTGEVDSDAERDLVIEIAKNASDVKDVEDNLRIVTETAMN
jgi:osmotically-inducible protein OsmY